MNEKWKRNLIIFLGSQTISLFGSSLVQFAITWYITLTTQSGLMMTISIVCGFLPSFILSPFAGVWADRYSRKKLIILADSMIALATLILAILFLSGYDMIWLLFVASALRSLGSAVQTPAVSAFLPQFVPKESLMKVNAINGSIQSFVLLASPMLSGVLMSFMSIESIFFIDVVTAAIALLILAFFVKVPIHAKALEKQTVSYFSDMKLGFVYIKEHPFLKQFFIICSVFYIFIAPCAFLTPLQVARSFGDDVWRLTSIEVAFSLGMLLGGILMASWGGFKNKVHTMFLSFMLIGIFTIALGIIPNFWVYIVIVCLVGVALPLFNTPSSVLLQSRVDEDMMGRVFSVLGMIASIMMPFGMLVFGPLADFVKIEYMLLVTGTLLCIQGIFVLKNRVMTEAGK